MPKTEKDSTPPSSPARKKYAVQQRRNDARSRDYRTVDTYATPQAAREALTRMFLHTVGLKFRVKKGGN